MSCSHGCSTRVLWPFPPLWHIYHMPKPVQYIGITHTVLNSLAQCSRDDLYSRRWPHYHQFVKANRWPRERWDTRMPRGTTCPAPSCSPGHPSSIKYWVHERGKINTSQVTEGCEPIRHPNAGASHLPQSLLDNSLLIFGLSKSNTNTPYKHWLLRQNDSITCVWCNKYKIHW